MILFYINILLIINGLNHGSALKIVRPIPGGLVPHPSTIQYYNTNLTISKSFAFKTSFNSCDIISSALERYGKIVANILDTASEVDENGGNGVVTVNEVTVVLTSKKCEKYPYYGMHEDYTLTIMKNGTAELSSISVWGIVRGLETFSQLIYIDKQLPMVRSVKIKDSPRFSHRGLLLDTSRHFLSMNALKANLDLMAQSKYNVFHWHIVDDPSFPFVSKIFPKLSLLGAYTQKHIYTPANVADVIEYARLRGIRVIPEFDTPGHTSSWGPAHKGLLTECYDSKGRPSGSYGPIDPTNTKNYDFILALLTEILAVFPDEYIHLGGDEVDFSCWKSNANITVFMDQYRFGRNYSLLETYYFHNLLKLVERARKGTEYLVWQEVFDNQVKIQPNTIVHVWKGHEWQSELTNVTKANFHAVTSACWYLNYIDYGIDWHSFYMCEPQNFTGSPEQKKLLIGGEACMWGEYVDDTNVISRTWPRASVVAERLWSPITFNNTDEFAPRLEAHRCRTLNRGYQVESVNGPGYCDNEWWM